MNALRTERLRTALAVVVAVVAVAAAAVALSQTTASDPTDELAETNWADYNVETPTGPLEPSEPTHTPEWSTDAQTVFGREFASFRSPSAGLMFDSGDYGIIDGGDVLISAVGLPNPRTYSLDSVELVGIDANDGTVRWSVAPGGIDTCASRLTRGELVCLDSYADVPALIAIAADNGSMRRIPLPEGWFPYGIESDGVSAFILEGNPEDSESVLHGGSVDALAESWSLPITGFATWDGIGQTLIHIHDDRGVVTLGSDAEFFDTATGSPVTDLELLSQTTVVDTDSGSEVWKFADPYAIETTVGQTVYSQDGSTVTATGSGTGDVAWTWSLPTGADGFTPSGTIVEAATGVYYIDPNSIVQLVAPEGE